MKPTQVRFEIGDMDKGKEVGIMIDILTVSQAVIFPRMAVIVLRSGRVIERPISQIEVVSPEIREMFEKIEDRSASLGLEVDTEH